MPVWRVFSIERSATSRSSSSITGRLVVSADDFAHRVELPAFAGSGQHDVVLFGIDEDVLNALQAGQVAHLVAERRAAFAMLGDRGFELPQRNFAHGRALQIAGHGLHGSLPLALQLVELVDADVVDHAAGVDRDTADLLLHELGAGQIPAPAATNTAAATASQNSTCATATLS